MRVCLRVLKRYHTIIWAPPPPNLAKMGPEGFFFAQKRPPPEGTQKSAVLLPSTVKLSIACCCLKKNQNAPRPSEHPPVMLVVVLGVAQKLNKYRKSPSVCVCFRKIPPGTFLPGVFSFFFKDPPPLPLSYPLPLIVFRKKYTSPRGEKSKDITVIFVCQIYLCQINAFVVVSVAFSVRDSSGGSFFHCVFFSPFLFVCLVSFIFL